MPKPAVSKAVERSCQLFRRLLYAYPKAHREEYGEAILQLFRDQCRDAWAASKTRGLVGFWLRAFFDLLKTSLWEHLSNLNQVKSMLWLFRPRLRPFSVFFPAWAVVFLLMVLASIIISLLYPKLYSSTSRVDAEWTPRARAAMTNSYDPYFLITEFEVIQSSATLGKVSKAMDLPYVWGRKYNNGGVLTETEVEQIIKSRLDLRPIRNTKLIEIRAFSGSPEEAAQLANEVASAYQAVRREQIASNPDTATVSVTIIDSAVPDPIPVRPNKPLNIVLGAMLGMLLGPVLASVVAGFIFEIRKRRSEAAQLQNA